ncbi:MAG: UDP-N-acetylmuramoylalanine--D-glutamate ligase, partial [Cognaticolwellia sp.]
MKIAILGAGESGVGAAILAKEIGAEVFVSDFGKIGEKYQGELEQYEIEFEEEQHTEERILSADLVIKSPGIPDKA